MADILYFIYFILELHVFVNVFLLNIVQNAPQNKYASTCYFYS